MKDDDKVYIVLFMCYVYVVLLEGCFFIMGVFNIIVDIFVMWELVEKIKMFIVGKDFKMG